MSDNEVIDFSKLSSMQKYKVGRAIENVLSEDLEFLSENKNRNNGIGERIKTWLAAANEIIPIARELGKK